MSFLEKKKKKDSRAMCRTNLKFTKLGMRVILKRLNKMKSTFEKN